MTRNFLYQYRHLPVSWADAKWDDCRTINVVKGEIPEKIDKLKTTKVTLLVTENIAPLIDLFLSRGFEVNDFTGLDFRNYYDNRFGDGDAVTVFKSKIAIIYNVGLERAVKAEYGSVLLKGLIKDFRNDGFTVIIQTDLSYADFRRKYGIELDNKITIAYPEEEKIF